MSSIGDDDPDSHLLLAHASMDAPDSPVKSAKRAVSTRTYGRAFRQRTSFGGTGGGGGGGSSGASTPSSSAGGAPFRRKMTDLSSSDDEAGPPLPSIKKARKSEETAGPSTTRPDAGPRRKPAPVGQAPTRASPRRSASLQTSSLVQPTPASDAVASSSKAPAAVGRLSTELSNSAPKAKRSMTGATFSLESASSSALLNSSQAADFKTARLKAAISPSGRRVRASVDRKGKSRASAAGMEIVLPEPRSSSVSGALAAIFTGVKAAPSLKPTQRSAPKPPTVEGEPKRTAACESERSFDPRPSTSSAPAASARRVPAPAKPIERAAPRQAAPPLPHSPKRIRLSSPPAHLKAQTPPGDILQQADYFSYPSPARNLFGVGSAGPSSPLTPLSSSVAQSSPLRRPLPPTSPTRRSATPQELLPPARSKPTPLVPASPSRTPTRSATNLSALFDQHIRGSGSSGAESAGDNVIKSDNQGRSPAAASSSSMTFGSGGVDEEGGSLGQLVNLPAGRRRVDRLLQRSNTAPSLTSVGTRPSGSGDRTPLGKRTISALFPSPDRHKNDGPAPSAVWDIPVLPSPSASKTNSPSSLSPVRPHGSQQQQIKRRTYGGSSRSMLAAANPVDDDGGGDGGERESYVKMAKRWGVDQGRHGAGEHDFVDDTIELTTVTSLRARGENQSFLDDLGYLLDGLRSGEISVRRSSSVDLLRKMVATEFRRSLKTYDQVESLWKLLLAARGERADLVLDASLAVFLALLARDGRMMEPILAQKGAQLCDFVCQAMAAPEDADGFALERKARLSKGKGKNRSTLNMVADLRKVWLDAELGSSEPSLRSTASSIFKHLSSAGGPKVDVLNLLRSAGPVVARSLHDEVAYLPSALSALEGGEQPLFGSSNPDFDFHHVHQCLVVLDSLLSRHSDDVVKIERAFRDLPSLLGTLLAATRTELRDPSTAVSSTTVTLCQISTLRMLLSLTNLAPLWAATVLEAPALLTTLARLVDSSRRSLQTHGGQVDEPKRKESPGSSPLSAAPTLQPSSILATSEAEGGSDIRPEDTPAAQLEILCLSLGLLSKLVETVDRTRALVRGTSVAPSCAETRTCVVACRCAGARSMLLVIVDLYEDQRHGTSAEASYLAGYAVLLLSHLMRSPENAAVILPAVSLQPLEGPGETVAGSDAQRKLRSIAAELQAFSDIHQRFHDKLSSLSHAAAPVDADAGGLDLGFDAEGLKEIQTGVSALPSKEAGVGAVREMINLLQAMAAAENA